MLSLTDMQELEQIEREADGLNRRLAAYRDKDQRARQAFEQMIAAQVTLAGIRMGLPHKEQQ